MDFDKCVEPVVYSGFLHVWHLWPCELIWAYMNGLIYILFSFLSCVTFPLMNVVF